MSPAADESIRPETDVGSVRLMVYNDDSYNRKGLSRHDSGSFVLNNFTVEIVRGEQIAAAVATDEKKKEEQAKAAKSKAKQAVAEKANSKKKDDKQPSRKTAQDDKPKEQPEKKDADALAEIEVADIQGEPFRIASGWADYAQSDQDSIEAAFDPDITTGWGVRHHKMDRPRVAVFLTLTFCMYKVGQCVILTERAIKIGLCTA